MRQDSFWAGLFLSFVGVSAVLGVFITWQLSSYGQELKTPETVQTVRSDPFQVSISQGISDRILYPKGVYGTDFNEVPMENLFIATVPLPYEPVSILRDRDYWKALWGDVFFSEKGMLVGGLAQASSSNAFIIFRAGKDWTDSEFSVTADWGTAAVLGLVARFADDRNFVECAYSYDGSYVSIYTVKNGVLTQLAQTPELARERYFDQTNIRQSIIVKGTLVRCSVNGEFVLQADVADLPKAGSVGFELWDSLGGALPHTITRLSVSPL